MFDKNFSRGITLLELLLVVALIGIVSGLSIPVYSYFQTRNSLEVTINLAESSVKKAQAHAKAMDEDDAWGIHFETGGITIFKGDNYSVRDDSYDDHYETVSSVSVSGTTNYIFTKLTGETTSGSTTFSSVDGSVKNLTINEKGTTRQ